MAVWYGPKDAKYPDSEEWLTGSDPLRNTCFYCHMQIIYPVIYWMGNSDILLHPPCAVELSIKLLSDVHGCMRRTDVDVVRHPFAAP